MSGWSEPERGNKGLDGLFRATLLGTGTSTGVPVPGCACAVCCSPDPRDARARCAMLLQTPEASILVDCGPDFRRQALRFAIDRVDHLLVTHEHSDHIAGLDDLRTYNFRQKGAISMRAGERTLDAIRRNYAYCFGPAQPGGGVPQFELAAVQPGEPFHLAGLRVEPIVYKHGALDVTGFVFGDRALAYMTDCSEIPPAAMEAVRGVDTLVIGALRQALHPTHFNIEQAVDAADRIGARRAIFIHMTHDVSHARDNALLPPGRVFGWDGLALELPLA